jgi:sulfate transport system ATP-binding protein
VAIEIRDLIAGYKGRRVLDQVSLRVNTGSMTALLGPSGSGKSTLLRCVAGLTPLERGTIRIDDRDVTNVPARDRAIGFCFQHYAPFTHYTVFDNVAYGLKLRKIPRRERRTQVMAMLERVGLASLADRYPHQLSGGQTQRMALARALIIRPSVLLLDEPFSALDARVRDELREWVSDLQRELRITTVLVTHDQTEAMALADELVILSEGKIQQVGAPDMVYQHPTSALVQSFLGPTTTFDGKLVRPHDLQLFREGPDMIVAITRLGFEVRVTVARASGERVWVQLPIGDTTHLAIGHAVRVGPRAT